MRCFIHNRVDQNLDRRYGEEQNNKKNPEKKDLVTFHLGISDNSVPVTFS